jgi:hypothetical protein
MGRVIVNNAVGVDKEINKIQDSLISTLFGKAEWNQDNFEVYHKAYKNPTENGVIPEIYTKHRDYQDARLNDNLNGSIFFTVDNNSNSLSKHKEETTVSIYVQLDIEAVYSDLDYRQTEPAHNDVRIALQKCPNVITIDSLVQTVPDVYSEFRTDNIQYTDMQPYHVFRYDVTVNYDVSCEYYCQFPSDVGGFEYVLDFGLN